MDKSKIILSSLALFILSFLVIVGCLGPGQSSVRVMRNNTYFDRLWNDVALFMEAVKE